MKTLQELTDIGLKATERFNRRVPVHGSAVTLEYRPPFSSTEACAAFAEAVRDAVMQDYYVEVDHLRTTIDGLQLEVGELRAANVEPPTTTEEEIPAAQWEGRLHGSQDWEDIWPEHDGQMSYGADITYVEIRRKGSDALT